VFKPLAFPTDQNTFGKKIKFVNVIKTEKTETRRDNEDSKISPSTDHLEKYGIADINSEADSK